MFRSGKVLAAFLVLLAAPLALASGFHVYEQGAKASGQAVAFIARADDPTAVYYNPAALTKMEDTWFSVGFSAVFIGSTTFDSKMDQANPSGLSLFSGGEFDMVNNIPTPVHFFLASRPNKGKWAVGFGVTTPFGLVTEWDEKFDGRFSSRRSDLRTFIWNMNVARDLGNGFSVALGVDYLDASIKDFSRNLSLLSLPVPSFAEPLTNLTGTGHDYGWNAALHWSNGRWSAGAMYRSEFSVDIEGNLTFHGVPNYTFPSPPFPPGVTLKSQLRATGGSAVLNLPATYGAGVACKVNDNLELEFDIHGLSWSRFEKLEVKVSSPTLLVGDTTAIEDWKDTISYRLGGSYNVALNHQLRFGIYAENSAIPTERLRPSIPDADRMGYTLGYGTKIGKVQLDAYYLFIKLDEATTTFADFANDPSVPAGTYDSSISLFGVTASFKF